MNSLKNETDLKKPKMPELKKICQTDKKKYKGFSGLNRDELIKHIDKCNNESNNESNSKSNSKSNNNINININNINNKCINNNKKVTNKLKFIDLFAGTGAFTLALEKNNKFECVFTNDMMECSKKIYQLNNTKHEFTLKDLNTINVSDIPPHNLLCGGFPCQPFSIAGEKKGFDDKRSNVFWKIIEILEKHKPEIIILENVKNLKSHDKGNTYKTIENKLKNTGYHIKTCILDTNKITKIPQHRERIYIVGFRDKDKYDKFDFDFQEEKQGKIYDMLEKNVDDKYYYTDRFKVFGEIEKGITKNISENVLYQYRRFYVRENKSNCCPTLTANMGAGGHNVPLLKDDKGIRKLTPRECFNLQGFPIDYKLPDLCDSALYKLAGNAVSVPVVSLIVSKLEGVI
jgi:DNA (cytosine-5)-methyltransferase 1